MTFWIAFCCCMEPMEHRSTLRAKIQQRTVAAHKGIQTLLGRSMMFPELWECWVGLYGHVPLLQILGPACSVATPGTAQECLLLSGDEVCALQVLDHCLDGLREWHAGHTVVLCPMRHCVCTSRALALLLACTGHLAGVGTSGVLIDRQLNPRQESAEWGGVGARGVTGRVRGNLTVAKLSVSCQRCSGVTMLLRCAICAR